MAKASPPGLPTDREKTEWMSIHLKQTHTPLVGTVFSTGVVSQITRTLLNQQILRDGRGDFLKLRLRVPMLTRVERQQNGSVPKNFARFVAEKPTSWSRRSRLLETVIAEYDPHWNCPKCGELTQNCDEAEDWSNNGDSISVVCHHADPSDEEGERECGHQYIVDLRG